jgi:20S proteasome subunit beta 5
MDALVAQYSRPAFEDEGYSSEDQQELTQVTPPLSLKFALPPIAQVCLSIYSQALDSFD